MPKFKVTPEMGASLKLLRQQRNIKAIDVAKSIDKTSAFISKLEKGVLNTIEKEDLLNIITMLSSTEEEFDESIQLLLSNPIIEFTKEESDEEEWKLNLDLFYRKMSVPEQYIQIIKNKMETLNISIEELVKYINSNFDLYNSSEFSKEMLDKAAKNHWHFNNGKSFIVVEITEEDVEDVLNNPNVHTNYSMLMCLLLSLFRLEKLPYDKAQESTLAILDQLRIYTLSEKEEMMRSYKAADDFHSILDQRENPALPESDLELINNLYEFTKNINSFAQIHGVKYVNEKFKIMLDNFENDPILFMGYMGINIQKLKDCDFQIKKEFCNAVKSLVDEYSIRKPHAEEQELL